MPQIHLDHYQEGPENNLNSIPYIKKNTEIPHPQFYLVLIKVIQKITWNL